MMSARDLAYSYFREHFEFGSEIFLLDLSGNEEPLKVSELGVWMAHSVKHSTLGFGSGCDLRVLGLSPTLGSALSRESA